MTAKMSVPQMRESLKARLLARSEEMPNGCREWRGPVCKDGYGKTNLGNVATLRAHRASYALAHDLPLPTFAGLVLHGCDNPLCINPAHLAVGTVKDNTHDRVSRGRALKGEAHAMAKLDADKVRAIRCDARSHAAIAREYGVHETLIPLIKKRRLWKHVD
jgi:hypothetical protein